MLRNYTAQIVGRKYVWLADGKFGGEMYPFGSRPVAASGSEAAPEEEADEDASLQAQFMTNTSRVDVLRSLQTQQLEELQTRFPAFVDRVAPEAIQVILEEGDMLVFPPGYVSSDLLPSNKHDLIHDPPILLSRCFQLVAQHDELIPLHQPLHVVLSLLS